MDDSDQSEIVLIDTILVSWGKKPTSVKALVNLGEILKGFLELNPFLFNGVYF